MLAFTFITLITSFAQVALAAPLASARAACSDVAVIFARGTTEPAPIGLVVGPPFQAALKAALGSKTLTFQGVDYAANVAGFLQGGDPKGAATMTSDINAVASACPNTKIVMSGYRYDHFRFQPCYYSDFLYFNSQGGQLVHLSAKQLSAAVQKRISSIVIFGDPDNGQSFPGNLNAVEKTFCATGDNICAGGALILPPHLSYGAVGDILQIRCPHSDHFLLPE